MKRYLLPMILMSTTSAFAQTPSEKAEKRLEDLVTVGRQVGSGLTSSPIAWKRASVVETIEPAPTTTTPKFVRLPAPARKDARPHAPGEAKPLTAFLDRSAPPTAIELPTQPLIRLPAVDVASPSPIPILSRPVKDRASLGDPAFDISLDAAMKRFTVARDQPIPFTPINLPDPFENLRYGQLRNPPEEAATPAVVPWRKPQ